MKIQDLRDVIPWGRSFEEYAAMFALSASDPQKKILDRGAGPASFTAEAHARGMRVVACDPVYRFTSAEIARRVEEVFPVMVAGMEADRERFVWTSAGSPAEVGERRIAAMRRFLDDLPEGLAEGRYVPDGLPALRFADGAFDLALSSHFLFLYSDQLSRQFHLEAIAEMLRVAAEVRIFPLLNLAGQPSAHLEPVVDELRRRDVEARVVEVLYEFQRGANAMLVIRRRIAAAALEPEALST